MVVEEEDQQEEEEEVYDDDDDEEEEEVRYRAKRPSLVEYAHSAHLDTFFSLSTCCCYCWFVADCLSS